MRAASLALWLALGPAPDSAPATVVVEIAAPDWSPEFRGEVEADLDLEFAAQGLALCVERGSDDCAAGVARVELRGQGSEIEIAIDDPLTHKRTTRSLDLADAPEAARSLSLVIATAELLRTSWAELALDHTATPDPPAPIPAPVEQLVAETFVRAKPPRPRPEHELTAGFRGSLYPDALALLGARVGYTGWFGARVGLSAALLGGGAPPLRASLGQVRGWDLGGELGLAVAVLSRARRFGLDLDLGVGARFTRFVGEPVGDATGGRLDGATVAGLVLLRPYWSQRRTIVRPIVGVEVPLRGLEPLANADALASTAKVGVRVGLEVGFTTRAR